MLKKVFLTTLTVLALVAVIATFGYTAVKTTIWSGGWTQPTLDMISSKMTEFEAANPDIKVEYVAWPWDKYRAKLISALTIKKGPDLFWDGFPKRYYGMGVLSPMDDYFEKAPYRKAIPDFAIETVTLDDKVMAIPWFTTLYEPAQYNKEMFEEAGIDAAGVGVLSHWEQLDFARRLTIDKDGDGEPEQFGYNLLGGRLSSHYFFLLMFQYGIELVDEKGNLLLEKYKPELVEILQYMLALGQYAPGGPSAAAGRSYTETNPLFANEKVAINTHTGVFASAIFTLNPKMKEKVDWFIAPMGVFDVVNINLSIYSPNKEEAKRLIDFMQQKDFHVPVILEGGSIPIRNDVSDYPLLKENRAAQMAIKQIEYNVYPHPGALVDDWVEIRPHIWDAVASVLFGKASPKAAADVMVEKMTAAHTEFLAIQE